MVAKKKKTEKKGASRNDTKPKKDARVKKDEKKEKSKKIGFEKTWAEYNSALDLWKESLARWQKATGDALTAYHNACQKALESDPELLKKISTNWESTWNEIGPEYVKQQTKMIESVFKETNIESIKKFNDQWEKFLKTSGNESIKAYQEAIKRFNQTWQSKM